MSLFSCVDPSTIIAGVPVTNATNTTSLNDTIVTNTTAANGTLRLLQNAATLAPTTTMVNTYANALVCWTGPYYIHAVFSIIVSITFIILCIIIQLTYFETKSSTQNFSAKNNSKPDVVMLIVKIITVLLFGFFGSETNNWVLIVVSFILACFMFFNYYEEQPYYNVKIMKIYLIITGIYLWNCLVLLIGKILETTTFDGCIPMFFIGIPIIIAIIITLNGNKLGVLLTNINKFQRGEKVQTQVRYFLELVDKKDTDRDCKALLKGYIHLYEETCTSEECALKKYISCLKSNIDTIVFLYQHAEQIYQNGISKFPNCTSLRLSYAFFLLERMNKKQQANLELNNASKYNPRFEEQFIIYRYKKLIEENSTEVSDNEENLDVVSNIAYKNHFNQFKNCISKAATLYIDFWGLLLNPNQDNNEDLSKLNDYGSKINILIEEITTHLEKMQKLKQNDQEVIRLYSDFLNDILNDKEKSNSYRSRLNEIEGAKQNYDDLNLINNDINALSSTDEYQYIVVSAQPEKFGTITNISLGICSIFGYTKAEILGKNIEALMPEQFHGPHRLLLTEKLNDYKKASINAQVTKNYKPTFKDITTFGKNKSRYLVLFNFKVAFLPNTEQDDSVFIAKVNQDVYNLGNSQVNQNCCYILTNTSFIIQNFTANSINILGMNSTAINNNTMEITKFIKNFIDEINKILPEHERTPEQVLAAKKVIINQKYRSPNIIIWSKKTEDTSRFRSSNLSDLSHVPPTGGNNMNTEDKSDNSAMLSNVKPDNKFLLKKQKSHIDETLKLTVTEMKFLGKVEGYVFKFEPESEPVPLTKDIGTSIITPTKLESEVLTPNLLDTDTGVINIDKSFVPSNDLVFHIDAKRMSYLVNPRSTADLKEALKDEAIRKLKNDKSPLDDNIDEEEDEEIEEDDENNEKSTGKKKASQEHNQSDGDYYKISHKEYELLVYDFKVDQIVKTNIEFLSQVEFKKNEDYKQVEEKKEDSDPEKKEENEKKEIEEEVTDAKGREGILIKQIEYALNKEENQPTITKLKWFSFFIFVVYITLAAVFLSQFLSSLGLVTANINLVYQSVRLLINSIYGVYHVRELTLLNNSLYLNLYQERSAYIKNNTDTILQIFDQSHDTNTQIITSLFPLTDANDQIINTNTINIFIVEDDFQIKGIPLTLSSAFIEINTALYHIANNDISLLFATDKDVFFYIYNGNNYMFLSLYQQITVYINELQIKTADFQMDFLWIFLAAVVFKFIAYGMFVYAYNKVGKRKESYLEVFFEIGPNVIKNSLEKCENFTKKLQAENVNDAVSNIDENEINQEIVSLNQPKQSVKSSHHKKRKTSSSREDRIIKIKMSIGFFSLSLFFFLVYFLYRQYLDKANNLISIYNNLSSEQSTNLYIYNYLREYFFDRNSNYMGKNINDNILPFIDTIYNKQLNLDKVLLFTNLGLIVKYR
jgi:PAS domain-containing protein